MEKRHSLETTTRVLGTFSQIFKLDKSSDLTDAKKQFFNIYANKLAQYVLEKLNSRVSTRELFFILKASEVKLNKKIDKIKDKQYY